MDGNGLNDIMLGLAFSCQYLNRYPGDSEYSSRISAVKMHIEKNNFSLIGFEYYLSDKETVHVR